MYRLISGNIPIESASRVMNDPLVPATQIGQGKYSPNLLTAIDHALTVLESDRPQSVNEWFSEINPLKPTISKAPITSKETTSLPTFA